MEQHIKCDFCGQKENIDDGYVSINEWYNDVVFVCGQCLIDMKIDTPSFLNKMRKICENIGDE